MARAFTQDLEYNRRVCHDGVAGRDGSANNESIRIADAARDLDFQLAPIGLERLTPQTSPERGKQANLNGGMGRRPSNHRDGLEPVELVAQFLPLLPGEELLETHRLAKGDVHTARFTWPC